MGGHFDGPGDRRLRWLPEEIGDPPKRGRTAE
jgi:hypothetical protein